CCAPSPSATYSLSLHDALPISSACIKTSGRRNDGSLEGSTRLSGLRVFQPRSGSILATHWQQPVRPRASSGRASCAGSGEDSRRLSLCESLSRRHYEVIQSQQTRASHLRG